jgi:hypothetical protein
LWIFFFAPGFSWDELFYYIEGLEK